MNRSSGEIAIGRTAELMSGWPDSASSLPMSQRDSIVMSSVRILGTPSLPHLSDFPETNVRLYAVDAATGRRGVVFRSLEAARLLPVVAARLSYHLPYLWARMAVRHGTDAGADTVAYETSRRWPGPRGAGPRWLPAARWCWPRRSSGVTTVPSTS